MLHELKQSYQQQLITMGVSHKKAEKAAQKLTLKDLQLIAEIWIDWGDIFVQFDAELKN